MTLFLPWPPFILSPNARPHWRAKNKAFQEMKLRAKLIARDYPVALGNGNIQLVITFHPPTRREPDLDNSLSRCKALLDGIAEAWGINDKRFRPITVDIGEPRKNGCVKIEVIS